MKTKHSTLPTSLGRHGDDPTKIMTTALEDIRRNPRNAAEWAYLGMHTALENAAGKTFRTDSAQREAVGRLAKRNKKLAKTFNALKDELHGHCFYQGECDVASVGYAIGKAHAWLEQLPKKI